MRLSSARIYSRSPEFLRNATLLGRMRPRLPLLDLRRWHEAPAAFAEELRVACHRFGFFQLRHRMPDKVAVRAMDEARGFFARPLAVKESIGYGSSPAFRGYMANGVENTAGKPDLREQIEIAAEGLPAAADAWPPYERLRGPNQWPDAQPQLREVIDEFSSGMRGVSIELTRALALAMGLEREALSPLFEPAPHWQLKLASYQPVAADASSAGAADEPQIGVGAHTDSGFLTLLLQDDSGGLEAFTQGEWLEVPPLGPGVIVCNLGEVCQMMSRGYLLATPHRVLSTPRARLSIPYFYNPALEATVEPLELPASLPWEREAEYDRERHWRRPQNALLAEYGANAFKSLARSHPAVFARHHSDLRLLDDGRVVRAQSCAQSVAMPMGAS